MRKNKKTGKKHLILFGFILAFLLTLYSFSSVSNNKNYQTLVQFAKNKYNKTHQHGTKTNNVGNSANNNEIINSIEREYHNQNQHNQPNLQSNGEANFNPHFSDKHPRDFVEAKRLARQIHKDHRQTFYCGCSYDKHNQVDLHSCGYKVQRDRRRARRLEWEHIVPISQLAGHLPCWKKRLCCKKNGYCFKGRRCCQLIDRNFAKMEADLHNIVPEIGELNAVRSNFRFGLLPYVSQGQFGYCEFKVDLNTRRVEPRPTTRGMVARAYLYMAKQYQLHLSDSQRQLFEAWNRQYPPDAWEKEWNNRIKQVQGNANTFIANS